MPNSGEAQLELDQLCFAFTVRSLCQAMGCAARLQRLAGEAKVSSVAVAPSGDLFFVVHTGGEFGLLEPGSNMLQHAPTISNLPDHQAVQAHPWLLGVVSSSLED